MTAIKPCRNLHTTAGREQPSRAQTGQAMREQTPDQDLTRDAYSRVKQHFSTTLEEVHCEHRNS